MVDEAEALDTPMTPYTPFFKREKTERKESYNATQDLNLTLKTRDYLEKTRYCNGS